MNPADKRWLWLADRIWKGTLTGWASPILTNKADIALLEKKLRIGHVEKDEYGMYRPTDAGLSAIRALIEVKA
jgi:hypothetical protein